MSERVSLTLRQEQIHGEHESMASPKGSRQKRRLLAGKGGEVEHKRMASVQVYLPGRGCSSGQTEQEPWSTQQVDLEFKSRWEPAKLSHSDQSSTRNQGLLPERGGSRGQLEWKPRSN